MKQSGFTLIELLIGMVISMLCIVMMLALFQQLSRASLASTRAAEYDSQLETGMLIAQKLLQNAGYGSQATTTDFAIGTYPSTATTPAIFWRLQPDLTVKPIVYTCYGLTESVTQSGANFIHKLNLLTNTPCDNTADITKIQNWTSQPLVRINSTAATAIFSYTASGTCAPFGANNVQGGKKVIITGNRADVTDATAKNIQRAVCLRNLP